MKPETLIQKSIIVDNAFGFEPEIEVSYKWDVINQFYDNGFTHLSLSVATDMTSLENTLHYMAETRAKILANPNYILVNTIDDIYKAKVEGKLALSFMFQGTNPIEKDLAMIEVYSKIGVKSMIIAYNINNALGGGCIESNDTGLSLLGKKAVKEMNQNGVMIDMSHTGYRTSLDVLDLTEKPVIFSHSNVNAIHPHMRNLKDDQIKKIADVGGFIGINGNGPLLGDNQASVDKYIDHIQYICDLVGDDYVGLGTDYVYFPEVFDEFMQKNKVVYPSHYGVGKFDTFKSRKPEQLLELTGRLQTRGFSDDSIEKILGANYLRVVKTAWE
ncbi:membrane dipeptidase [Thiotrichales bacterium 19X7-9]|nr:membrane dipeptidase [Thiotrichales bacterium 19X7-9]